MTPTDLMNKYRAARTAVTETELALQKFAGILTNQGEPGYREELQRLRNAVLEARKPAQEARLEICAVLDADRGGELWQLVRGSLLRGQFSRYFAYCR